MPKIKKEIWFCSKEGCLAYSEGELNEYSRCEKHDLPYISVEKKIEMEKQFIGKYYKDEDELKYKLSWDWIYGVKITDTCFGDEKGKSGIVMGLFVKWLLTKYDFITMRDTDEVYYFNGGYYEKGGEKIIHEFIQRYLMEIEAEAQVKKYLINETIGGIQRSTYTKRDETNIERYITMENGVYDVEEQKVIGFSPEILNTTKIPVTYDPEADCPKFKEFLTQVLNPEDIPVIQELFGYCLLKDYRYQSAFMFWGTGSNGKSILLDTLIAFVGKDNISGVALQDLEENRFAKAELYGKMANIFPDLSADALKTTGAMKMLTGGDMIQAEEKFKNGFRFYNHAKLIFSANMIPASRDDTHAFWRRWIILTFPNEFSEEQQDKNLLKKLTTEEEMSGIFNWAVEGLKGLLKNDKFSYSVPVELRRALYIKKSDPVWAFSEEILEPDPENQITKDDLYNYFKTYCKENAFIPTSKESFGKKLLSSCEWPIITTRPRSGDKRVQVWQGMKLKDKKEEDSESIPVNTTLV